MFFISGLLPWKLQSHEFPKHSIRAFVGAIFRVSHFKEYRQFGVSNVVWLHVARNYLQTFRETKWGRSGVNKEMKEKSLSFREVSGSTAQPIYAYNNHGFGAESALIKSLVRLPSVSCSLRRHLPLRPVSRVRPVRRIRATRFRIREMPKRHCRRRNCRKWRFRLRCFGKK